MPMCPKCKVIAVGEVEFCRFDGTKMVPHTKVCTHCKKDIWANDSFCEHCGRPTK